MINHRVNGLDLTSWSPSHALLYIGTAIMIAGLIRAWYLRYPREGRYRWQWTAGLVALFAFFFENAHFPQLQQEYGILGDRLLVPRRRRTRSRRCWGSPPTS